MLTLLNLTEAREAEAKRARRRDRYQQRRAKRSGRTVVVGGSRMYHAARPDRLTTGWGQSNSSADVELSASLNLLRARSRALVRDSAYAKRAKEIIQNNVVGSGIGLQAHVMTTRDQLNERINDDIEAQWREWSRATNCHTGGRMHFFDIERAAIGEVFEAGEVFIRKHPRAFGESRVPLALEFIEAERIADQAQPSVPTPNTVRMGVEVDALHRPVAYWIRQRHPGELRSNGFETDFVERVPADQIIHICLIHRWPQTRGVPWLHATARRLNDMDGYGEAEIVAARGAASYMATIETPHEAGQEVQDGSGDREEVIEPGIVKRLAPGEELNFVQPNRPNTAFDAFMRSMLREVAAGTGVSYESLSRDYSQSNFSSSRLALLDDRDLYRMLQLWFIRQFREELHKVWLQQAVLAGAIQTISREQYALNPQKFEDVMFKPRGWGWIDPAKEITAAKEAIKANLTSAEHVIAQNGDGRDIYDVLSERQRDLRLQKELGLIADTDPELLKAEAAPKPAAAEPQPPPEEDDDEQRPQRLLLQ